MSCKKQRLICIPGIYNPVLQWEEKPHFSNTHRQELSFTQPEVRAVRSETTSEWLQWPLEISDKGTQRMPHADRSVGKPLATSIWR